MWCVQGWCELSFRGKRKKNLHDQQYKQKHHLMMKAIKTFLMWIVSNYIKKMENKLYSNITCPNPTENIGKGLHY